jgi:hypothetical protein
MIYMIVPVLLAFLVGILRGGQVRNLARFPIQHAWVPLVMISLQISFVLFPQRNGELFITLRPWVNSLTYALLLAFLAVNRRLPGMKLILLGAALNLAVIAANGGFMPVTPEALERSGHLDLIVVHGDAAFVRGSKDIVLPAEEIRLALFSDIISTPEWFPVAATMSIGDIFIMLGSAWLVYRVLMESTTPVNDKSQESLALTHL